MVLASYLRCISSLDSVSPFIFPVDWKLLTFRFLKIGLRGYVRTGKDRENHNRPWFPLVVVVVVVLDLPTAPCVGARPRVFADHRMFADRPLYVNACPPDILQGVELEVSPWALTPEPSCCISLGELARVPSLAPSTFKCLESE